MFRHIIFRLNNMFILNLQGCKYLKLKYKIDYIS